MKRQDDAFNEARRWARLAWKRYRAKAPIDLARILNDLHIEIYAKDLPDSVAGIYVRKADGCYIVVNRNHPETRIRWTVAHEIKHHLDSRSKEANTVTVSMATTVLLDTDTEKLCDAFAAELLMPDWCVIGNVYALQHWKQEDRIRLLCQRFGVSKQAMRRRLQELGLLISSVLVMIPVV
jgi:Zn-dependent peptidase ImmA (M78 family)